MENSRLAMRYEEMSYKRRRLYKEHSRRRQSEREQLRRRQTERQMRLVGGAAVLVMLLLIAQIFYMTLG